MIKPLSELVEPGWAHALADVEPTIYHMDGFLHTGNAAGRLWLSASHDILCAFTIPPDSTKVLIIGQDPCPTPGHSMDLSFCVAPNVYLLPKSLINIYKELVDDLGVPIPTNGNLAPWAERGAILFNRCLIVGAEWPNSHQGKDWEEVIGTAVRALDACTDADGKPQPLVMTLWEHNA